jgi:hypothetical protein
MSEWEALDSLCNVLLGTDDGLRGREEGTRLKTVSVRVIKSPRLKYYFCSEHVYVVQFKDDNGNPHTKPKYMTVSYDTFLKRQSTVLSMIFSREITFEEFLNVEHIVRGCDEAVFPYPYEIDDIQGIPVTVNVNMLKFTMAKGKGALDHEFQVVWYNNRIPNKFRIVHIFEEPYYKPVIKLLLQYGQPGEWPTNYTEITWGSIQEFYDATLDATPKKHASGSPSI